MILGVVPLYLANWSSERACAGGFFDPFKGARSGIILSQSGCGPPPGISPGIGVLPKATIPPTTVIVPTPGARLIASQGGEGGESGGVSR
jgi:hypothetical protein